jgi:hypothetical protein
VFACLGLKFGDVEISIDKPIERIQFVGIEIVLGDFDIGLADILPFLGG